MITKSFSVSIKLRQGCVLFPLLFITYLNKIDRDSSFSGVPLGKCNVWRLLFADDLALLRSNESDLQYALDRSSDACLNVGMRSSSAKTEVMCLLRHPAQYFQKNGVTLQQTEKFEPHSRVIVDRAIKHPYWKGKCRNTQLCRSVVLK